MQEWVREAWAETIWKLGKTALCGWPPTDQGLCLGEIRATRLLVNIVQVIQYTPHRK